MVACFGFLEMVEPLFKIAAALGLLLFMADVGQAQAFYEKSGRMFEDIDIVSVPDADCTLYRDKSLLLKLRTPRVGNSRFGLAVAPVDITSSKSKIAISCVRTGFRRQSTVISFGPQTWSYVNPPCSATSDVEIGHTCAKAAADTKNIKMEYPEVVRLLLQPSR